MTAPVVSPGPRKPGVTCRPRLRTYAYWSTVTMKSGTARCGSGRSATTAFANARLPEHVHVIVPVAPGDATVRVPPVCAFCAPVSHRSVSDAVVNVAVELFAALIPTTRAFAVTVVMPVFVCDVFTVAEPPVTGVASIGVTGSTPLKHAHTIDAATAVVDVTTTVIGSPSRHTLPNTCNCGFGATVINDVTAVHPVGVVTVPGPPLNATAHRT